MTTSEENKRLELLTKYTNWIKKSKLKLLIVFIIYCTSLILNFLFFKNYRIFTTVSLLMFTYAVYAGSLIWFINNKLIAKIDSVDFKAK